MEQKQSSDDDGSVCYELPPLSSEYPWFVSQNLGVDKDSSRDQYFYTPHDEPRLKYQCQIPQLHGRRIRGSYHGWVILSERLETVKWSLWNPATSEVIQFPLLVLKHVDSESIRECCLSAPREDPSSVLLLTSTNKPFFVFVHLHPKKKKQLTWVEMSYASQLKRISAEDRVILHRLTCCNGKVYALTSNCSFASFIIQIDVVAKVKEVIVNFSLFGSFPSPSWVRCDDVAYFLKGNGHELFIIILCFHHKSVRAAQLLKLDASISLEDRDRFKHLNMCGKRWEEDEHLNDLEISMGLWDVLVDLKEAIVYLDLGGDNVACYRDGLASKLGGYVHIRDKTPDILYSFNVKEKTISISSLPSLVLPTNLVSLWECRLHDDDHHPEENEISATSATDTDNGLDECILLNLPYGILEMIMEQCRSVEYMTFRATCKSCKIAAPLIQWSNTTSLTRLETYSLVSPWLMVVDENQGIITLTDPMLGDNYFMRDSLISLDYEDIYCSRFGWLFFYCFDMRSLVLYNPFTKDLLVLPDTAHRFKAGCFSAPPTSPDCMVVGFSIGDECLILIHCVARESSWQTIHVDAKIPIRFLTFFGEDLYGLDGDGKLVMFKELGKEDHSRMLVKTRVSVTCGTPPTQHYLMKWDQHLLKVVIVGRFGEGGVELFKWDGSKEEWEKIDGIGNHMIYICDTTCLCIEAKKREMGNKIYFPVMHSKNRKVLFYSLETCTFDTFNGENIQHQSKGFIGTTHHLSPHVWIEPSWLLLTTGIDV